MNTADLNQLLEQAAAAATGKHHFRAIHLYTDLLALTEPRSSNKSTRETRLIALRERGRLNNLLGDPLVALADYEQYYQEAGDSIHAVDALVFIGNQCTYMNRTKRAMEAHRDALQLAQTLNYTAGQAKALGGLGLVFTFLDRPEEALTDLRKSLVLFEKVKDKVEQARGVKDKVEQARGWNRIGVVHVHLGQLDKAIAAFQASFDLAREVGQKEPIAMETAIISVNNLGECYQRLFDMEQALVNHQKGLAMAEETELPYLEADLLRNLGVDLQHLGRVEEGIACLHRSLQLSVDTNQPDVEVQALYSLAMGEFQRGNLEQAEARAEHLSEVADRRNIQGSQAEALYVLGLYQEKIGQVEAAQRLWQQALFLAHETGRRMLLWQIHGVMARIASNADLAAVHNRIAVEIIHQIAQPIENEALREKFMQASPVREIVERLKAGEQLFG
jgi:tetratricopeptide (TPR) repeat protein